MKGRSQASARATLRSAKREAAAMSEDNVQGGDEFATEELESAQVAPETLHVRVRDHEVRKWTQFRHQPLGCAAVP